MRGFVSEEKWGDTVGIYFWNDLGERQNVAYLRDWSWRGGLYLETDIQNAHLLPDLAQWLNDERPFPTWKTCLRLVLERL
jgi:hypothetical protein